MQKDKSFKFADNRVFIDIGEGCGNACKYCYLDDSDKPQKVFDYNKIYNCIQEILINPKFKPGKKGTIISFCPHTEPFKSSLSTKAMLFAIKKLAPYKNLMQLATKETIPDFFITAVNDMLDNGQLTAFISISSLEMQNYFEPFASDYRKRFENINNLRGSKVNGCIYLKPFLFKEEEFENLLRSIKEVKPDAVCIGILYTHLENQTTEFLKHPTEDNLLSKGTNEEMHDFYNYIKSANIPIFFTSTCVIAYLNHIWNDVTIPQDLCVNCNEECFKQKWPR